MVAQALLHRQRAQVEIWPTVYRYILVSQVVRGAQVLDRYDTRFGVRSICQWDANQRLSAQRRSGAASRACACTTIWARWARPGTGARRNGSCKFCNAWASMRYAPVTIRLRPNFWTCATKWAFWCWTSFPTPGRGAKKSERLRAACSMSGPRKRCASDGAARPQSSERDRLEFGQRSAGTGHTTAGAAISQRLTDIFPFQEDPTRPVGSGNNYFRGRRTTDSRNTEDIFGYNYKPGRTTPKVSRRQSDNMPLFGSETASTVSSRGEYFFPVKPNFEGRGIPKPISR